MVPENELIDVYVTVQFRVQSLINSDSLANFYGDGKPTSLFEVVEEMKDELPGMVDWEDAAVVAVEEIEPVERVAYLYTLFYRAALEADLPRMIKARHIWQTAYDSLVAVHRAASLERAAELTETVKAELNVGGEAARLLAEMAAKAKGNE